MRQPQEARIDLRTDEGGRLVQSVYGVNADGHWFLIRSDEFGPFDTLHDALVRALGSLSPILRVPLR